MRYLRGGILLAALFLVAHAGQVFAAIVLKGADNAELVLPHPAQRIVSLAPHLTDILLALEARAQIAAVIDDHENRGAHTASLSGFPVVADASSLNYEKVLALKPDVVLAWGSGTPRSWIEQLRHLGLPVLVMEVQHLSDLVLQIEELGRLSGHEQSAQQQAQKIRKQILQLQQQFSRGPRLTYFYQVWRQPLYSLNAGHLLSQGLALCGADNIVPAGPVIAPLVNPEFVLRQNPDVILFDQADASASRAYWNRFSGLQVAQKKQWLAVDDKRLTRPGPEMLEALVPICEQFAAWRKGNPEKSR